MKKQAYLAVSLTLAFLITTSGCVSNAQTSDITTADASINTAESSVAETKKEPAATAVVTKPTQKTNATPTPSVKETTAVTTTKASETTAPVATTKATATPTATTKAPAATTSAPPVETAAPPIETASPVATTAAYTPNCDNIRSLIVSNLQSRGYWFPDATSIGGGSASVTTNYFYSDEKFAEGFLKKFAKLEEIGTMGIISVSVWIENGYVNFSCDECAYPTA